MRLHSLQALPPLGHWHAIQQGEARAGSQQDGQVGGHSAHWVGGGRGHAHAAIPGVLQGGSAQAQLPQGRQVAQRKELCRVLNGIVPEVQARQGWGAAAPQLPQPAQVPQGIEGQVQAGQAGQGAQATHSSHAVGCQVQVLQPWRKKGQLPAVSIGHLIGGQVEGVQGGQRQVGGGAQAAHAVAVQQQGGGRGGRQARGGQAQRGCSLSQAAHATVDESVLALRTLHGGNSK